MELLIPVYNVGNPYCIFQTFTYLNNCRKWSMYKQPSGPREHSMVGRDETFYRFTTEMVWEKVES